ncbi:hypothetical protein [Duganella phyllosphaerae]|uniref:Cytoskeleton protein RodZ n=1 Tax=Duganella phyllosphaerae TaxID=762836 RepID=A0A1E7W7R0_9BURK|nr:hypothetical protein [Duganella phyllosphaerae]OEZ92242.1 hypothetical protein DUPY_49610 [Duganella phyllosphaerae]
MKRLLLSLPLLALCAAHAQPQLGRLFNTPQERQAIDASRNRPAGAGAGIGFPQTTPGSAGALAPAMSPAEAQRAGAMQPSTMPAMPAGMQAAMPAAQAMPQGTRPGFAPDVVPALPPNLPPGMQAEVMAMARTSRELAPTSQPQQQQQQPIPTQMPMPMPGSAPAAAATTETVPEQLTMNGVLRSSNGRSTIWLNNVPQRGAANKFSNRDSKAVAVTLPSGRRIVLQPGQRYDLADGRVKDVSQ